MTKATKDAFMFAFAFFVASINPLFAYSFAAVCLVFGVVFAFIDWKNRRAGA